GAGRPASGVDGRRESGTIERCNPQRYPRRRAAMTSRTPEAFGAHDIGRHLARRLRMAPVERPRRLPSAAETAVWRARTAQGVWIVKVFAAHDWDAVRTEVALCDYLRAHGLRTPDPLAGRDGQRIGRLGAGWRARLRGDAHPVLVVPLDRGRRLHAESVTREELLAVARYIGRMHALLQVYPQRDAIRPLERWSARFGSFDDFLASATARAFPPRELARLRALDLAMERRAAGAAGPVADAHSVLHGDLGLQHVRLPVGVAAAHAVPFLFDFSDFARGPVVADLATMLAQIYCASAIDLGRWEQLGAWLLEGYRAAFALAPADEATLADA